MSCRQKPAGPSLPVVVKRAQVVEQLEGAHERLGRRRVHKVKVHQVVNAKLLQLQHHRAEVGPENGGGWGSGVQRGNNGKGVLKQAERRGGAMGDDNTPENLGVGVLLHLGAKGLFCVEAKGLAGASTA